MNIIELPFDEDKVEGYRPEMGLTCVSFETNELAEASAYVKTNELELHTWLTGDGDCIEKGAFFVNRFLYLALPKGLPDYINLEDDFETWKQSVENELKDELDFGLDDTGFDNDVILRRYFDDDKEPADIVNAMAFKFGLTRNSEIELGD